MSAFDTLITGGTVIDGTGAPPREADIAIVDGRIAAIAPGLARAGHHSREQIDARSLLVTPGFIDVHTHYDGQATWDSRLWPSSQHGVTTAVMGNCGVGFAPCKPEDRDTLVSLMEGVEDIPGAALAEGLPWNWESFAQYLDAVAARARDIDIAALLPHGPVRVHAMGERAVRREAANAADLRAMQAQVRSALAAGAMGLSTSRTLAHRTADGHLTPTFDAASSELTTLGEALAGQRSAVFQMISDWADPQAEFDMLRRICRSSGCAGTLTLVQVDHKPQLHEQLMEFIAEAQAAGERIIGQVIARPVGVLMGMDTSLNPFSCRPAYRALNHLPLDQRVAQLARPEVREAILAQEDNNPHLFMKHYGRRFERMFALNEQPDYLPGPEDSAAAQAQRAGVEPARWLYQYLLGDGGRALAYVPLANYRDGTPQAIASMLSYAHSVPALGDGGAHVGTICDASAGTFILTEWVRARGQFSLAQGIQMLTQRPAALYGMHDRGQLTLGLRADINLIDIDALAIERPRIVHDLPAGGRRFVQGARGYRATLVNGQITYRDGAATAALPGRLLRRAGV